MECQENLGSYLNLPHIELLELCKRNNLPASSTTQLAKSLASFSKNAVSLAPLKASSSDTTDAAPCNGYLLDTEHKEGKGFTEVEAVRGAYERSVNSSESDTCKMPRISEENVCGDKQHFHMDARLSNCDFMNHQTLDTACYSDAIHSSKFNNKSTYVLDWSLPEHGDVYLKNSVVGDAQQASVGSQLGPWYDGSIKIGSPNSQNPRSYNEKLLVNSPRDDAANLPSSRHAKFLKSPIEVGYASSYESCIKAVPSLDFFVMSDDGINLYVDLNSSTSEWIQKLKDEVCINKKIDNQSSIPLTNYTRDHLDADVQTEPLQSESIILNLQKEADRGTGFTSYSFGSIFSGTNQEVYPLDATLASSGSSILTSSSNPIDICNQVVSSGIQNSNSQNLMTIDNMSIQHKGNILHDDSRVDNSSRMEHCNAGHEVVEVSIAHNSASTICVKNNILNSDFCINNVNDSDVGTSEVCMCVGNILERKSRGRFLLASCDEQSSGSCQLVGLPNLNSAAGFCQNHSNILTDYVPKKLISNFGENLITNVADLEKERLECPVIQISMDKNSKRSSNPEFDELALNIKKRRSDRNNKNGYLGCTLSSIKENISDATIPPRRSSRFLSK